MAVAQSGLFRNNSPAARLLEILLRIISIRTVTETGIGTTTPDASALLDVSSTTKGFLPPRMTTAQRVAIVVAADGMIVYDTVEDYLYIRRAGAWTKLADTTEVSFSVYKTANQAMTSAAEALIVTGMLRDLYIEQNPGRLTL